MSENDLVFTEQDAESIFAELGELSLELDTDPLAYGPKRLNQKTAEVRKMLDRCERIFLDVYRLFYKAQRTLRIQKTELEMQKKNLFANDPETRAGRSVSDREAIAAGKLSQEMKAVHDLDVMVVDLESMITVIKAKRSDLKDIEGRLKDQIRLCQSELGIGAHWGSQVPEGTSAVNPRNFRPATTDAKDIANIIDAVEGEVHLAVQQGTWIEEEETPGEAVDAPVASSSKVEVLADLAVKVESAVAQGGIDFDTSLEGKSLEGACPATVTNKDVDEFLAAFRADAVFDKIATQSSKDAVFADGDNFLDLLVDFEQL